MQENNDKRQVMSVVEAGAILGLSRNGAYEAVKRGEIPTLKIGSRLKVPRAAFERMLAGVDVAPRTGKVA